MKPALHTLIACSLLALFWTPTSASLALQPVEAPAQGLEFEVDPLHSGVLFRIEHMQVSAFHGRFTKISGRYFLDQEDPAKCEVEISIDAASADSASEGRDKHITGPDFMNAKQFPTAEFRSTSIVPAEDSDPERPVYLVTGMLNLRGEEGEVTFPMTLIGEKVTRMGHRSGFEGRLTIDRREFGMERFPTEALGAEIELTFFIEGLHE